MDGLKNKRNFGSFHSSNVQELITLPDEEYKTPELPVNLVKFPETLSEYPAFGLEMRRKHFLLEDVCTFLNHGAFGAVLKEAIEVSQKWQLHVEKQPLRFLDRELIPHLVYVTRRMASFVNCKPEDLVLIQNVTTGANCVVKSLKLQPGDKIFCLSVTYGAVKKLLKYVCTEAEATLQEAKVTFPLKSGQEVIDLVEKGLLEGTRLAVFDHIPSNTPFIMPVKQLIQLCHEKGVPVMIDGAHALGGLDLDISDLDPDYYLTNCHKWFCAPKGCALMYVNRKLQASTRTLIISHGFGSGYSSEYIWTGLKDYSGLLALHTVLDFWEALGPHTMREYMHSLLKKSCSLLMQKWKTRLIAAPEMFGSMGLVQLPPDMYKDCDVVDYSKAELVQNILYHKYNIEVVLLLQVYECLSMLEVPIKAVDGHLYCRLSAHIYNYLEEYNKLGDAVLEITNQGLLHQQL